MFYPEQTGKPCQAIKLFLRVLTWGMALGAADALKAHPLDNWHGRYTNAAISTLSGITFGNGLFVAVGTGGAVLTSLTGQSWASQTSGTTRFLRHVSFGNGAFVAVGDAGTILSSIDGTNWQGRVCAGVSNDLWAVEYGRDCFVATGGKLAVVSLDGTNWTAHSTGAAFGSTFVAYGNGLFLLESKDATNAASTNGIDWFPLPSGSPTGLYTMGFGRGMFVAIDILNHAFTSLDGTNWTQRSSVSLLRPSQIAYGSCHFVTVGGGPILFSRDAEHWNLSTNGYLYVSWGVAYGRGTFVAVGGGGRIIQSDAVICLETGTPGRLGISGPPGSAFSIEASCNPELPNAWQSVTNMTLTESPWFWTDPAASAHERRFYRALMLP